MRKYTCLFMIVTLCFFMAGCASTRVSKPVTVEELEKIPEAEKIIKEPPKARLPEYEKLTYEVRWLGMNVAKITATVNGIKNINGKDAYELIVTAKTSGLVEKIYKVDDRFVSYMDVENFFSLRHEVYRREGRYKKDAVTDFDQVNHKAHFRNSLDKSEKDFDIPPNVQDTLSACYYFRLLPLKVGDRVDYAVCNNEANYELFGTIGRKECVRLPRLGKFDAFYIQPYAKLKGEEVKKGRVSGYFSFDEKRIPLMAVVQAPVFTEITAALSAIDDGQKAK